MMSKDHFSCQLNCVYSYIYSNFLGVVQQSSFRVLTTQVSYDNITRITLLHIVHYKMGMDVKTRLLQSEPVKHSVSLNATRTQVEAVATSITSNSSRDLW